MKKVLKYLLVLAIITQLFAWFNVQVVNAQYCGGSVQCCSSNVTKYYPAGCSRTCDETEPGCVKCTSSDNVCDSYAGSGACSGPGGGNIGGGGCNDNCNGIVESGSCTYYPPQTPAPTPYDYTPPDDKPTSSPAPPPQGYTCLQGIGCVPDAAGGSYDSCSANCPVDAFDPKAGLSSCEDTISKTRFHERIYPGKTKTWQTWSTPTGLTAADRLNGSVNTKVTKSYTSPSDKFTMIMGFTDSDEGSLANSVYLYNSDSQTWYFYNGKGNPPVIFTLSDFVYTEALKIGFTDASNMDLATAQTYTKRVYRLNPPNTDCPWRTNSQSNCAGAPASSIIHHIPHDPSLIPLINCASTIGADDQNYFRLSDTPIAGKNICHPRGSLYYETFDMDGDNYYHLSGNYLGLENDFNPFTDMGRSIGANMFPYPDERYMDDFKWTLMARTDRGWANGFVRQAIFEIPVQLLPLKTNNEHYGYVHFSINNNSFEPINNEEQEACMVTVDPTEYVPVDTTASMIPYNCSEFVVTDASSGKIVTDNVLQSGKSYKITSQARNETYIYTVFNQNFAQDISYPVVGWKQTGLSLLEIVECKKEGFECAVGSADGDTRTLKYASATGNPSDSGAVYSQYFETKTSLTGQTITVEFDARSSSGTQTISSVRIRRYPYTNISVAPYKSEGDIDANALSLLFEGPDGSLSESITLTPEWKHYIGVATFPNTHPNNSDTSQLRIAVRAPSSKTPVYIDNFHVIGTKQPTVKYIARKESTVNGVPNYCSLTDEISVDATPNAAGDKYSATINIPAAQSPGKYVLYAELATGFNGGCSGNPSYSQTNSCGLKQSLVPKATANCSTECSKSFEIEQCVNVTPAVPTSVNFVSINGPEAISTSGVNELKVLGNTVKITAQPGGSVSQQSAVTKMIMEVRKSGSTTPVKTINGVYKNARWEFDYTLAKADSNEVSIKIFALNEDHCDALANTAYSSAYTANLRFMSPKSGFIIEIPRNEFKTYACYGTGNPPSEGTVVSDIGNPSGKFKDMQVTVNTDSTTMSPYILSQSNDPKGYLLKFFSYFSLYTPHNPDNTARTNGWGNKINSVQIRVPLTEEEEYICVNQCNPQKPNVADMECVIDGTRIPKKNRDGSTRPLRTEDLNIYVAKGVLRYVTSWWQSRGGLVFANGAISSALPIWTNGQPSIKCLTSTDVCQPFINARMMGAVSSNDQNLSAGIVFGNSTIDDLALSGEYITQRTPQQYAAAANPGNKPSATLSDQKYDYFSNLIDWEQTGKVESSGTTTWTTYPIKPTNPGATAVYATEGTKKIYVFRHTGDLTINLTNKWTVPDNTKILIFVTGTLTLNGPTDVSDLIKINETSDGTSGGFLGFFVKKDIIVDRNLGFIAHTTSPPLSILEGVFMADQDIIIDSKGEDDLKFVAKGSFIGHRKIQLNRTYKLESDEFSVEKNSQSPVEMFIFDPALVVNTPALITKPQINWQETN